MKKLLLIFFLSTITTMGRLHAYCIYNKSNEKIFVKIFSKRPHMLSLYKARYVLKPGKKGCWNWKEIDKKNRKKEWYWIVSGKRLLGKGYFPIGGAVAFFGYDNRGKAIFKVYFDGSPWKYKESPWNHKSIPWQTYSKY